MGTSRLPPPPPSPTHRGGGGGRKHSLLLRVDLGVVDVGRPPPLEHGHNVVGHDGCDPLPGPAGGAPEVGRQHHIGQPEEPDRKSTRLNSSHVAISYAVFCLKKKKKKKKNKKKKKKNKKKK